MRRYTFIAALICTVLLLAGCASTPPPKRPAPDSAQKRQLELAQSFETGSDLRRAIFMYQLIANSSPRSAVTIEATRKSAVLTGSVRNPQRSDSLSLQWFRKYLSLPIAPAERENAELSIFLLDRFLTQQRHGMFYAAKADSLQEVVRRQGVTILSQSQRIADLEREVRHANAEVRRMKEIDVRLSQSRKRR